jgi:phosphoribosylanthranilate isomerase
MSPTRVKICGITSRKDLHTSVKAGADAVGFVVDAPRSPRNLTLKNAKRLVEATPIFIETVAVTVPQDICHLVKIHSELKPDALQIHGLSHNPEEIRERLPDARLIHAVQVQSSLKNDAVVELADVFDAILLDSYVSNGYGGTGKTHSWEISRQIRDAIFPKPLILAGGLKPENVEEAIKTVKPYAVDVSTGVESRPGVKNERKIFEFIKNAGEIEI